MEIYIMGDLHGDLRRFQPEVFYEQEGLTKEDMALVCGDFGCVWHGDGRDDESLDWLERRPFTTAFVTGNHENYDALRKYPLEEWRGGIIRRIRPSVILLERGQQPRHPGRHPGAGRSSTQEEMQSVGCQGRDVPGEPPVLVERGAAQRGGVPDRQGQLGQSRLGGGLHHHPLLLHLGAG